MVQKSTASNPNGKPALNVGTFLQAAFERRSRPLSQERSVQSKRLYHQWYNHRPLRSAHERLVCADAVEANDTAIRKYSLIYASLGSSRIASPVVLMEWLDAFLVVPDLNPRCLPDVPTARASSQGLPKASIRCRRDAGNESLTTPQFRNM
jgi:hypothetical protein